MKNIAIIGSTGSIGTQALEVINSLKNVNVIALSANNNHVLLNEQIEKFRPDYFGINNKHIKKIKNISKFLTNEDIALIDDLDFIIIASTGITGLQPMILALEKGKKVGIANKESLVIGGPFIKKILTDNQKIGAELIPIDSEHSAIWQCMVGENWQQVESITITASGGSLIDVPTNQMSNITPEVALKHPNWSMGNKITIDSATLFNKALEVIEANILFDLPFEKINAIIHRESIIHSIVNYIDGSSKAQMGLPDMHVPIQYALTYPNRTMSPLNNKTSWLKLKKLSIEEIDHKQFPIFKLIINAAKKIDGTLPAMIGADEILVNSFIKGNCSFNSIYEILKKIEDKFQPSNQLILDNVLNAYKWGEEFAMSNI
ncbi:MAG: 1-deoxy-D-xylulose-5-phosphate reductoisomerase [Dehalococcoidia bacterium]|nr:1-deoxy-D-xylulose-5-phosphate reductoisomerase [Dehalococcoidia bacterium]